MAAPNHEPALPWGQNAAASTPSDDFEGALRKFILASVLRGADTLQSGEPAAKRVRTDHADVSAASTSTDMGPAAAAEPLPELKAGQRIEVKWQLTVGEGDDVVDTAKWWGATLVETQPVDGETVPTWLIRYDAHDSFEEETQVATFLTHRVLLHEQQEPLAWRCEGESYEPSDDDDDEAEETAVGGGDANADTFDVADISRMGAAMEQDLGSSVEQAAMQKLQAGLNPEQQQRIAAGFSDFASHVIGKLKQVAEEKQGDRIITEEDVKAACSGFKPQL